MRSSRSIHKRLLQPTFAAALILTTSFAWADSVPNHVHDVKVHATDTVSGAAEIEVVGTSAPVYNLRVESGGKKLVVDISEADVQGVKEAMTSAAGVVSSIMTQAFTTEAGKMTRLSINLTKPVLYRVKPRAARCASSSRRRRARPRPRAGSARAPTRLAPVPS